MTAAEVRRSRALPVVPWPAAPRAAAAGGAHPAPPDLGRRPDLTEADLVPLLHAFYAAVAQEPLLAPYFAALDMAEHVPRIAGFWATVLFQARRYEGNAFRPHLAMPGLAAAHFARWLAVLEATVDARHAGPAAEELKDAGHRIAYAMQLRLGIAPAAAVGAAAG